MSFKKNSNLIKKKLILNFIINKIKNSFMKKYIIKYQYKINNLKFDKNK